MHVLRIPVPLLHSYFLGPRLERAGRLYRLHIFLIHLLVETAVEDLILYYLSLIGVELLELFVLFNS